MEFDYDVIVAGDGIAGLLTATSVSIYSDEGLRILVVTRNSAEEVGKKTITGWTCGDAVSKRSVDYVNDHLGISYGRPEIEHSVNGVVAFSPDHETKVLFDGQGYVLNRKMLPKRQLKDAQKRGVEFRFNVSLEKLYCEDGFVKGVIGTDLSDRSVFRKTARVVVDATGSSSRLRTGLSVKSYIERELDRDDLEATGRYILEFEAGGEDKTYFDPDYCIIHLDQDIAPGGYAWVFPKGERKVNIGLGVQGKSLKRRNERVGRKDSLQKLIDDYVRGNPVVRNPRLADGVEDRENADSSWQVPVRRQNDCLVANGYAVVGDAAWMARPIDAGGIGPLMYASVLLGKTVAEAVESNDPSEGFLWKYNIDFINLYGFKMAGFEVLRRFLQTLDNRKINFGMKNFLSYDDVEKIAERENPEFSLASSLAKLPKAFKEWKLATGLRYVARKSRVLKQHYLSYPTEPDEFPKWHGKLTEELEEAYKKFS